MPRSAAILDGPAFILGNGPTLPADLSCLDGYLTVGVNRIRERYDPTCLLWLDADAQPDLTGYDGLCLVRSAICTGPWVSLTPSQELSPWTFVDCKNSGVSAAY